MNRKKLLDYFCWAIYLYINSKVKNKKKELHYYIKMFSEKRRVKYYKYFKHLLNVISWQQ